MTIDEKLDYIIEHLGDCPGAQDVGVFVKESTIDGVGRLTIPKSIRRELGIDENTTLKIYRGQNEIIIKKG